MPATLSGMSQAQKIRRYSSEIARQFLPEKVILFGSHATRKASRDSDVDLLVIMPHDGPAAFQAARIRSKVRAPFALDLIVRSPEVIRRRLQLGDSFLKSILDEGVVLYESDR